MTEHVISNDRPLPHTTPPGATHLENNRYRFCTWAPRSRSVELVFEGNAAPAVPLERDQWGYWSVTLDGIAPGTRYRYRLDGKLERPDMAARSQPEGVHGPSEVVDPTFSWNDRGWYGLPLRDYVIYELHVGTFTEEGTFTAIIPHLPALKELGVTAIELMPIATFPGERNWGYDGVFLYAPHHAYGGSNGLKQLVDACHAQGLAVILDLVYNHLGPEGNYLWDYGPYFTANYHTPWGDALNFDGPLSYGVRHFIIANVLYWLRDFHIDAIRLDAIHAIYDFSARHVLAEMASEVAALAEQLNRRAYLIAESGLNDSRVIRSPEQGGYGLAAQWSDDFHHALHCLLTGEQDGYYADYGQIEHLARAYRQGFTYTGEYAPRLERFYGNSTLGCEGQQFVVFSQNHDHVGNRALGDRLAATLPFAALKLAAGAYMLAPFLPLIFMGEEYAETAPFQYFVSHSDPQLIHNVREGRKKEFAAFVPPGEVVPDPQDPATFQRSKLNHELRQQGHHQVLWQFYRELLRLRRELPALRALDLATTEAHGDEANCTLWLYRKGGGQEIYGLFNFSAQTVERTWPIGAGRWQVLLDSAAPQWAHPGEEAQTSRQQTTYDSAGEMHFRLLPWSFVVLGH
jgi:maltooligosyltrehalose trehalohydrolase